MHPKDKEISKLRIDRWLWATRFYKTRNLATEACKRNWVKINKQPAKASKEVTIDDVVSLKVGPLEKIVRVDGIVKSRVSASLAQMNFTDLTPPEVYEEAKAQRVRLAGRIIGKKGLGRPTKKQRRDLDDFLYANERKED